MKIKEKIILMLVFVLIMQVLMPISNAADVLEKGDVNADKSVNVQDLIKVKTYILGGATLTEEEKARADMNSDDSINIQDVVLLKVKILESVMKDRYTEILEELQEILEDKIEENSGNITLEEYLKELIEKGIIDETDIIEGEDENTKIIIVDNQYVYEVKVNEDGEIEIEYKGLIEDLSPEIKIEDSITTTTTITIKVETERNVEGKVQYLIKEDGTEEYQLAKETTDLTYTFTNLTSNKKYNVKVVAVSNNGKTAEDVLDITTKAEPKPETPETPDTPVEPEIPDTPVEPDDTDKTAPMLEVTGNVTAWTNKDVVLTIEASDETELDKVTVNGTELTITNGQGAYTATQNGIYTIVATDKAGNTTTKEVKVDKIDKTVPILSAEENSTSWTNGNVTLTIKVSDEQSGLNKVTVNGTAVTITNGQGTYTAVQNGTYTIVAIDNANNTTTKSVTTNNIDKTVPTLKVTYSITQKTNQNVTVTIESNEEIKAISGWTLSSDKKKLTKVYSANASENVTVSDLAGNSSSAKVSITNIDKTVPTLKVIYSTTSQTKQNVTATIESNEEIKAISGWTLSSDKKKLTKVYSANASENVTVSDLAGNNSSVKVSITNIDKTAPTCTITASTANTTNANTITYLFTWSEAVTGFTADDIAITGIGTKVNFSGSGNEYRLIVTTQANQNGTQTVSIVAGKCTDLAGNSNSAASKSIVIDKIAPTCTITRNVSVWTNASSITYTFTWSETITGFTVDDIEVTNGTKGTFTEVTANKVYTLVVMNNQSGAQSVRVIRNTCTDVASNNFTEQSTLVTNVDRLAPVVDGGNINVEYLEGGQIKLSFRTYDNSTAPTSGLSKICINSSNSGGGYNTETIEVDSGTTTKQVERIYTGLACQSTNKYYIEVYDNVGNKTTTGMVTAYIDHDWDEIECNKCERTENGCTVCGKCKHCLEDAHVFAGTIGICGKCGSDNESVKLCLLCQLCEHCQGDPTELISGPKCNQGEFGSSDNCVASPVCADCGYCPEHH